MALSPTSINETTVLMALCLASINETTVLIDGLIMRQDGQIHFQHA